MRFFASYYLVSLVLMFYLTPSAIAQPPAPTPSATSARAHYMKAIQQHVETHWSYKKTLDNQFYSVQVTLVLDRDGLIRDRTIDKVSPDRQFNMSAVRQLAMMEPFPPIPAELGLDEYEIRLHLMPNAH